MQEQDSETTVLDDNEEVTEEATTSEPENETVEQSIRAALKDIQEGKDNGDQGEAGQETISDVSGKPEETVTQTKSAQPAQQQVVEDYAVPNRLSPTEKELFNKLPKKFKPAVARMFKDHEALQTRTQQDFAKHTGEAKHIVEAVRPYYVSHPELAENGVTESAFIAALVGAHQKLTNPKTDKATIEQLARDRGYRIKFVREDGTEAAGASGVSGDISNHPDFVALRNELNHVKSHISTQAIHEAARPILSEMQAVQAEKDSFGRFTYPELQDGGFIEFLRPRISELVRTQPGLSYGDALRKAVIEKREALGYSGMTNQIRSQSSEITNRAVSAANTVRGRIAPVVKPAITNDEIPKNETPEQSARIALAQLQKGLN
jgi:hypothetical protein